MKAPFVKVTWAKHEGKRLTARTAHFVLLYRDQFGTIHLTLTDPSLLEMVRRVALEPEEETE